METEGVQFLYKLNTFTSPQQDCQSIEDDVM